MRNFYYQFCIGIFLIGLPLLVAAQDKAPSARVLVALDEATVPYDYFDPSFPVKASTGDEQRDMANYRGAIEAYAKAHPPFPVIVIENPTTEQMDRYMTEVENWMSLYGSYFPRFIEYSRYNKLLKPADDYLIYETVREAWLKRNPDKASVIEEAKGYLMNFYPEKYNAIVNNNQTTN